MLVLGAGRVAAARAPPSGPPTGDTADPGTETMMPIDDRDAWEPSDEAWDGHDDTDDSDPTLPCPACGAAMFEDSPRCPSCGEYVTPGGSTVASRPAWILITAVLCLAIALWWIFGGPG